MTLNIEINVTKICRFCGKIIKPKRKTCGSPVCQYKHHIKHLRDYWNQHYRKSDQVKIPAKISTFKHKIQYIVIIYCKPQPVVL